MMELRHKYRYFFNTVCWLTGIMTLDTLLINTCSIQTCFATFLCHITSNKSGFRHVNFTSCGPSSWWRWKQFLLFPLRPTAKPSRRGFSLLHRHCRGSASISEATDVCCAGPGYSPPSVCCLLARRWQCTSGLISPWIHLAKRSGNNRQQNTSRDPQWECHVIPPAGLVEIRTWEKNKNDNNLLFLYYVMLRLRIFSFFCCYFSIIE